MTPHVECKLEDAPENVGREMRKFWREDRHEALSVRVFIGFVRPGREPGAGRGREDLREVRRVSVRAVRLEIRARKRSASKFRAATCISFGVRSGSESLSIGLLAPRRLALFFLAKPVLL